MIKVNCPKCGVVNETERDVCWQCFSILKQGSEIENPEVAPSNSENLVPQPDDVFDRHYDSEQAAGMPKGSISLAIALINLLIASWISTGINKAQKSPHGGLAAMFMWFGLFAVFLPISSIVGILTALPGVVLKKRLALWTGLLHLVVLVILVMKVLGIVFP